MPWWWIGFEEEGSEREVGASVMEDGREGIRARHFLDFQGKLEAPTEASRQDRTILSK